MNNFGTTITAVFISSIPYLTDHKQAAPTNILLRTERKKAPSHVITPEDY